MVEGGKIDWACHANDAAATITDTIAMDEAVGKAVEFYNEHPDETLILVTGDHETGGLTIGFAGTDYDTFLANIIAGGDQSVFSFQLYHTHATGAYFIDAFEITKTRNLNTNGSGSFHNCGILFY